MQTPPSITQQPLASVLTAAAETASAREESRRQDLLLIDRASKGDSAAFAALLRKYEPRVFAVAQGILRNADDARDVSQEVFWRAHRAIASYDGSSAVFTWLYRITINLALDSLRKRKGIQVNFDDARENESAAGDGLSPRRLGLDPQRALEDQELRGQLERALARLSPTHRAVLVLREVEGLRYAELAEVIGCSLGTVMSRLFHARRYMQKFLLEESGEVSPDATESGTDKEGTAP